MNVKAIVISLVIGFLIGLLVGVYIGYAILCPSTNDAVVKQLKKDDKKVKVIDKKEAARKVDNEAFKKTVKEIKDVSGCTDVPNSELRDSLYDSLKRP
jgi:uncharacterized membrane protein YraQ (UPF0718 family)